MSLKEMYKGIPNSPETIITSDITASQTTITVEDTSAIPELPNLLVLGGNTNEPETVKAMFIDGNTLTVERGFQGSAQAWEAGTKISRNFTAYDYNTLVENINDLQQQHNEHKADYEQHTSYAIATGTNSYAVNIDGVNSLVEGMSIKVKFQNANTGTATLNINGLGAKAIKKSNGNDLASGNIKAGQILHLVYTGSVFQLLGEGGEYGNVTPDDVIKGVTFGTEEGLKTGTLELTGNAAASQVLTGRTFYTTNPKTILTGSMPNRGAINQTLTTQGGSYTIPAGYHNGSGRVIANFANLVADNIKKGVNIGGVVGTLEPLGDNYKSYIGSVYVGSNNYNYINIDSGYIIKFSLIWSSASGFGPVIKVVGRDITVSGRTDNYTFVEKGEQYISIGVNSDYVYLSNTTDVGRSLNYAIFARKI